MLSLRRAAPLVNEWWLSRVLLDAFAVLLRFLACLFYAKNAVLHLYIKGERAASSMLGSIGEDLLSFFDTVTDASVLLAVAHGLAICLIVWNASGLSYFRRLKQGSLMRAAVGDAGPGPQLPRRSSLIITTTIMRRWITARDRLTHCDHALEKRCRLDSHELLVAVEIALQTFQVYKLSQLVATPWINRLMMLVIVVNCWFVPITGGLMFRKKTPTFVKVVHLALDAVLEIVYDMVIPLAIFAPYLRDAYHIMYDTPFLNFYMDTWYINAIAENRQLYVTSWIDFASKMTPGVSLLVRLYALQAQRAEYETRTKTTSVEAIAPLQEQREQEALRKKRVVSGTVLFIYGLGILALHLAATAVGLAGRDPSCLLEMTPLASTQYSCAVLEVSCSQKKISGSKTELEEALSGIDASVLQMLIFSHCEALAMPPHLQAFPNLLLIKMHNCSIAEWGSGAALTAQSHPSLQSLYVTMANMSAVPEGLLSPAFPPTLVDVEFCGTNLTALPTDLFEKWKSMHYFFLELSPGITEFPVALRCMNKTVSWLSLSSNKITSLPEDLFAKRKHSVLLLSGNPITKLPKQLGIAFSINTLVIAFTGISEIPPSWTQVSNQSTQAAIKSGFVMSAGTTPLCDKVSDPARPHVSGDTSVISISTSGSDGTSGASETLPWFSIECSESAINNKPFYYPLEYEK